MSTQKLLQDADKLQHANKVFIRDFTPEEAARLGLVDHVMLVCLLRPQQPQWARAEVVVDLNRVDEPVYRAKVLEGTQKFLNEQFETLQPISKEKARRGKFKERLDVSRICEKAKGHAPRKPPVEEAPPELRAGPVSELLPAPPPEPKPLGDLAGKTIQRKQRKA